MLRKSLVPLLFAVVASLSIWIINRQPESPSAATAQYPDSPDGYMENFTTTIMNAEGQPSYTVTAAYMAHFPVDDHAEFRAPFITLKREPDHYWTIAAEQGRAEQGAEIIHLLGEVLMHRHAAADDAVEVKIVSRDVTVLPDASYAETRQPTHISQGVHQLQSVGLKAYFEENRLQLLAQVRGVYVP